jgi:hypothetical protein
MGDFDKLPDSGPGSYRFAEHRRRYLDALIREGYTHLRKYSATVHADLTETYADEMRRATTRP